ncbi:MAG: peptidylprolyl isomerase, partial [Haloferula sp.]
AARALAQDLLERDETLKQRVDRAFLKLLSRAPTADEFRLLEQLHKQQLARYQASPKDAEALLGVGLHPRSEADPAELAALTSVTRALFNLHESITSY